MAETVNPELVAVDASAKDAIYSGAPTEKKEKLGSPQSDADISSTARHDPMKELGEIRNQISYSKRVGFFFGAGTSKAIGISDIAELTTKVRAQLTQEQEKQLAIVEKCFLQKEVEKNLKLRSIEDFLNQVRLIRQITFDDENKNYDGISGAAAKLLDTTLCKTIYNIISSEEKVADISPTKMFMTWLDWFNRDFPKELFTTNYDLVFEKALEDLQVPYFDGFLGANEPFFVPQSLELDTKDQAPPTSWVRLWKIHGSLGWSWKLLANGSHKIVRQGFGAKEVPDGTELVIYPSKDKYQSSKKQPFISYLDRLKIFLSSGEGLFIVSGYSFSDEHINSVIFNGLRQNNRLHLISFFYSDAVLDETAKVACSYLNFVGLSPKKALINGVVGKWIRASSDKLLETFWSNDQSTLVLGDFKELVRFLLFTSGKQEKMEASARTSHD